MRQSLAALLLCLLPLAAPASADPWCPTTRPDCQAAAAIAPHGGKRVARHHYRKAASTRSAPIAASAVPLPRARPAADLAGYVDQAAIAASEAYGDDTLERDRNYLALTASPRGVTMSILGIEYAISQLHPTFVRRAAAAIAEARASGLPTAGLFSSYRPAYLGVGAFHDKLNSLHAYGLAGDFYGIGRPGSSASIAWHAIATRHKLYNPYGPRSGREWNHYQVTRVTIVLPGSALRRTVTRRGPVDVARMWRVAEALIDAGPDRRVRLARRVRLRVEAAAH